MKLRLALATALSSCLMWAGDVTVTAVTAQQRYPWNGLVDITVTMQGAADDVALADCFFAATNSATGEALPIEHVTQTGVDSGSGTTWTRKFIWDATADVGEVKIADVALTVDAKILGGVQLWEGGPYWAECNVGATKPEEYGYYFWWGDTVGYKRNAANNGWVSIKDGSSFSFDSGNCPTYGKSNSQLQSAGYIDATGNLVAAHDAATAHLGAPWRQPTDAEFAALISNCDTQWTVQNGVYGRLVKGRGAYATQSIFLPAAGFGYGSSLSGPGSGGYFWSSTPNSGDSYLAWDLFFSWGSFCRSYSGRYYGQSVRPVRGFAGAGNIGSGIDVNAITTHLILDCRNVHGANGCEMLQYSSAWETEYEDAVAEIAVNDEVIKSAVGNGTVEWVPTKDGVYRLTHTVKVNDAPVGKVLATRFVVGNQPMIDEGGVFVGYNGEVSKELVIPDGVLAIAAGAFANCTTLETVSIPSTVQNIATEAFIGCVNLTDVVLDCSLATSLAETFPDSPIRSVTLGENAEVTPDLFAGVQLEELVVSEANERYRVENDCLVSKDGRRLIYALNREKVIVPDSIGEIEEGAFSALGESNSIYLQGENAAELILKIPAPYVVILDKWRIVGGLVVGYEGTIPASLAIPEGVRGVAAGAFANCTTLDTVSIPSTVENIGTDAFAGCVNLTDVVLDCSLATSLAETFPDSPIRAVTLGGHTEVTPQLFAGVQLEELVVSNANGRYRVENDCLVSKDGRRLIYALNREKVIVPECVEQVDDNAFDAVDAGSEIWICGFQAAVLKEQIPEGYNLRICYEIQYENLKGAINTNPSEYILGSGDLALAPLLESEDDIFAGWNVPIISGEPAEDPVVIHANWRPRLCGMTRIDEGDATWFGDRTVFHDGGMSLRSGAIGKEQSSTLKASFKGHGTLTFWWKVNCEGPDSDDGKLYDYLEFLVDGERPESVEPIAGDVDWQQVTVRIDGHYDHEIAWTFTKDDWDEEELVDAGWVDGVVWTPDPLKVTFLATDATSGTVPSQLSAEQNGSFVLPGCGDLKKDGAWFVGWSDGTRTVNAGESYSCSTYDLAFTAVWHEITIQDALGTSAELTAATGGTKPWVSDVSCSTDAGSIGDYGVAALRSGAVSSNGETTWMEVSFTGSVTFSFDVKVEGLLYRGKPANYLEFALDDNEKTIITTSDWTNIVLIVESEGRHVMRWAYVHTRTQTTGADCAWVDGITVKPNVYSPITYLNLYGVTHDNPGRYLEGSPLELSAPSAREGYAFTGWTPVAITPETTGDVVVTANWAANTYRIVYDANGGEGETAETACTYDVEAMIAANAFTRRGYRFAGWALDGAARPESAPYLGGETVRNLASENGEVITLYAIWEAAYSSITYTNLMGSTHTNPAKYHEGERLTFAAPSEREGYAFTGWTPASITPQTTGDIVVTANWALVDYQLYIENGAVVGYTGTLPNRLVIPQGVNSIQRKAFRNNLNLQEIWLPEGLESIEYEAFLGCRNLKTVHWPTTLRYIRVEAFAGCHALTSGDFGATVLEGAYEDTFCDCPSLTEVWLPATLTEVGGYLFGACDHLQAVHFAGAMPRLLKDYGLIYSAADRAAIEDHQDNGGPDWDYEGVLPDVTTYVLRGQGWDSVVANGVWQGRPIAWDEEILVNATVGKEVTGLDEPVTVPASWVRVTLNSHYGEGKTDAFKAKFGENLAAALAKPTGKVDANGRAMTVWDDYVAGTDPTDPTSVFKATIEIADGVPKVTWSPDLGAERVYRVLGAKGLLPAAAETARGTVWEIVTEETRGPYNFFKVVVEMP